MRAVYHMYRPSTGTWCGAIVGYTESMDSVDMLTGEWVDGSPMIENPEFVCPACMELVERNYNMTVSNQFVHPRDALFLDSRLSWIIEENILFHALKEKASKRLRKMMDSRSQ